MKRWSRRYNPVGSFEGRDPAGEPCEEVEFEWRFSHIDLFPDHECDGEFIKRTTCVGIDRFVSFYECTKCRMAYSLNELKKVAQEVYYDYETKCLVEVAS